MFDEPWRAVVVPNTRLTRKNMVGTGEGGGGGDWVNPREHG